ncbi:hypothetical protein phiOC_p196 [Ochrobactrum phage vB_OspM_OC]|nr:hypothetical protein phiOC_p196 [Ochrobactrum phage vB_OspM_OC]
MPVVVIGSTPIIKHYKIDLGREPADIDVIMSKFDLEFLLNSCNAKVKEHSMFPGKYLIKLPDGLTMEADVTESESSRIIMNEANEVMYVNGYMLFVPPLDILIAMKKSHIKYPVNALKNLKDWLILKDHYEPSDVALEVEKLRGEEAYERHKLRIAKINLNKPNEHFFKPAQNLREFDHDALHRIVAYHDVPLFEKCKHDMNLAKIDRDLFEKLSHDDQVRMAKEECMVIAYERYNTPNKTTQEIYEIGIAKFTTELCKGWFQQFVIDNLAEVFTLDFDFVERINAKREEIDKVNVA